MKFPSNSESQARFERCRSRQLRRPAQGHDSCPRNFSEYLTVTPECHKAAFAGRATYLLKGQFVQVARCQSLRTSLCRAIVIALADRARSRTPTARRRSTAPLDASGRGLIVCPVLWPKYLASSRVRSVTFSSTEHILSTHRCGSCVSCYFSKH